MKITMMETIKVEILFEVNYCARRFLIFSLIIYSACVNQVDVHKEEIQLTIDSSMNRMFSVYEFFTLENFSI